MIIVLRFYFVDNTSVCLGNDFHESVLENVDKSSMEASYLEHKLLPRISFTAPTKLVMENLPRISWQQAHCGN